MSGMTSQLHLNIKIGDFVHDFWGRDRADLVKAGVISS
jgi:hypothetical protein